MSYKPTSEILRELSLILAELRSRGITRTENIPTGDLAEYLVCKALALQQAPNSEKSFDAIDTNGVRYQVKGRRVTEWNPSLQLSAIRELPERTFDILAVVLFDQQFQLTGAYLTPHSACEELARYVERTNSYTIHANAGLVGHSDTENITEKLQRAYEETEQGAAPQIRPR